MSLHARTRRPSDGATSGKRGRPESLVRQYWQDINEDGVGPKCLFCDHRSQTRVFRAPPATRHTLVCKNAPEEVKAKLRRLTNNKYSRRRPTSSSETNATTTAAAAAAISAATVAAVAANPTSQLHHGHEKATHAHMVLPLQQSQTQPQQIVSSPPPPPPRNQPRHDPNRHTPQQQQEHQQPHQPQPQLQHHRQQQQAQHQQQEQEQQLQLQQQQRQKQQQQQQQQRQQQQQAPLSIATASPIHPTPHTSAQLQTSDQYGLKRPMMASLDNQAHDSSVPSMSPSRHLTANVVSSINPSPITAPSPSPGIQNAPADSVVPNPMRSVLLPSDRPMMRSLAHVETVSPRATDILYSNNPRLITTHEDFQSPVDQANTALVSAVIESLFTGTSRKMEGPIPTPAEFRAALNDIKEAARAKSKRQRNEARAESAKLHEALAVLVGSRAPLSPTPPLPRAIDADSDESDDELGNENQRSRRDWTQHYDRK